MYSISNISDLFKYLIACNETPLNILLNDFMSIKQDISPDLLPKNYHFIHYDEHCTYKMGEIKRLSLGDKVAESKSGLLPSLKYKCKRCEILSIILEYDVEIDKPFNIKCYGGDLYKLRKVENVSPYYKILYKETLCNTLQQSANTEIISCTNIDTRKQNADGIIFLQLDSFTNNSILTLIIKKILDSSFGHYVSKYITSFICSNVGFMLELEYPELKLRNLDGPQIKHILVILFSILHSLSKYEFLCGGISYDSVKVLLHPTSYTYDGVKINSNLSCLLYNLEDCSISFSNIRIYKKQVALPGERLQVINTTLYTGTNTIRFFKIKDGINVGLHDGYITHRNALNTYIYMVLLFNEKNFKEFIISNQQYKNLWEGLWLKTEISNVEKDIKSLGDINEYKLLNLLKKYNMRYDAIDYIWNGLKQIN